MNFAVQQIVLRELDKELSLSERVILLSHCIHFLVSRICYKVCFLEEVNRVCLHIY